MKKKSGKSNNKNFLKKFQSLTQEEKEDLYNYYLLKKEKINQERYDFLKDIGNIDDSISSYHEKEWELRKLSDRISECQLNLTESNISLINERKKIMKYINEIEDFRCKSNILLFILVMHFLKQTLSLVLLLLLLSKLFISLLALFSSMS